MAYFVGTGDNDRLEGTSGDDTLQGLAGHDTLIGGGGVDTAFYDFRMAGAGVVLDASVVGAATAVAIGDGEGGTDRLEGIEQVEVFGSIHADAFIGGAGSDTLWGAVGNDTLDGASGNDSVDGFQGDDSLLGGSGDDWLRGDAGNDTLLGGDGFDTSFEEFSLAAAGVWYDASAVGTSGVVDVADGRGGIDRVGTIERLWVKGSPHDDRLDAGATGDYLWGGAGSDTLTGGAGDDWLHGDDGADTARFSGNLADYAIDYDEIAGRATIVDSVPGRDGSDRLEGVELLQFADGTRTVASAAARELVGGEGNDTLEGSGADDTLRGMQGDDTLVGQGGADLLEGGAGHDWFEGGIGNDTLIGGDGVDGAYYDYWNAAIGVRFDGSAIGSHSVVVIDAGQGGTDRLEGIERLFVEGSPHADSLIGGAGPDSLLGEQGDDVLTGGGGDDWIHGGAGNDAVVFSGNYCEYSFSYDDATGSLTVTDGVAGRDGADRVDGVDYLRFADVRYAAEWFANRRLVGTDGNEDLTGGWGNDTLIAQDGNDRLFGNEGRDSLSGGAGDDWLEGDAGNDLLAGDAGNDDLLGGAGDDTLLGGAGNDNVRGDGGADTVVFRGAFDQYEVAFDMVYDRFTITDRVAGRDGTDRVREVEWLQFSDAARTADELIRAHSTPDPRTPDPSGLPYFIRGVYLQHPYGDVGVGQTIRYWFATSALPGMVGFAPYSPAQQAVVRQALDRFSAVANLRFEEVPDEGSARLRFFRAQIVEAGTGDPGIVTINSTIPLDSFDSSAYLLQHELGHTLGLRHPFGDPQIWLEGQTLMSYSQQKGLGPYDLAALHYLYGCNPDERVGDDLYGFGDRYVWDGGGVDTLSAATAFDAVGIDLAPGAWCWLGSKSTDLMEAGQVFIGVDTWIEHAVGGAGADRITGNLQANRIEGGRGDDLLSGGRGSDTLSGGAGLDVADYRGDTAVNADLTAGVALRGIDADRLIDVEAVFGSSAADVLRGIDGPVRPGETFRGGGGNDSLFGGTGTDTAEFLGNLADYTISRTSGTLDIVVTHKNGGTDGIDRLSDIEHLLFADRLVCFGPRAEDVARVAFALWTPLIVGSATLFSKGMSFYDNEYGYSFDFLCEVVLQWHPELGPALASKLKANIPAIAYSEAQLLDIMNAHGGGDSASGRAAAVKAVALDAATTAQLELMGVMNHGVVATHNFDAEVYFGLLPG